MDPNPVLRKLGFAPDDRVVILHADDVGMCHASLAAFADLVEFGLVSCGSVMVPCPWFPAVAEYCRRHPHVDLGVHLTLTSEWDGYRWGPISTRDPASGLIDEEGYFHHRSESVRDRADPDAAQQELNMQVDRALAAGIDVTHLDTHMGAVADLKFTPAYLGLALARQLPALMLRLDEAGWRAKGLDGETAFLAAQFVVQLEAQGVPLLDRVAGLPLLVDPGDRAAWARKELDSLPAGLTHFIIHPAQDTPELRAMTPSWRSRVADYQTFCSQSLRTYIQATGIQVIGYRALRELIRSTSHHGEEKT